MWKSKCSYKWRVCPMDSLVLLMRVVLCSVVILMVNQVSFVNSYLNLYISKEDLKNDLFLDFDNDIYILSNGKPAPLLSSPKAFKNLIAPLPPSISKIKFHWDANPMGDFRTAFEKKIMYSLDLSSSDTDVMAHPKASIAYSDTFYLPRIMPEFIVDFPCSGNKDGLVDLAFNFNYSINSSDLSHKVTIIVRRHCYKIEVKNIPALISRSNITTASKTISVEHNMFSNNTILGIILGGSALVLSVMIIFILRFIQQRNKRLHMKFDIDYELKMKEREQEDLLNSFDYEIDIKTEEKMLVKRDKSDRHSKPIYIPTAKKHRKWKLGRRKHHMGRNNHLCYSTPSLENIIEEDCGNDSIGNKDSPVILNLNLSAEENSQKVIDSNETRHEQNKVSVDALDVKSSKENVSSLNNGSSIIDQSFYTNNHVHYEKNDEYVKKIKVLNDEWSVQYNKYILYPSQIVVDDRYITKDSFSQIHRGKVKGLDTTQPSKLTPISVKIMLPSNDIDSIRSFMFEAHLMKKFSHENIMDLLGLMLRPTSAPFICSPHMRHSDLNQLLRNSRATPRHYQTLSTRQLINFGVQISNGMKYLSRNGFIHSALCAQNIMVNSAFTIKIAGLRFARDSRKQKSNSIHQDVTPFVRWFSVETIKENIFNEKTDIWSFGIVIWELMTFGKQPYSGLTDDDVKSYILDYHRLPSPPNCPDLISQIMYNCWQQLPRERPNFADIFDRLSAYEDKYKRYVAEYVPPPTKIIS